MAGLCRTADELRCVSPFSFHVLAERLVASIPFIGISMTCRASKLLWDNRLRCLLPVLTNVLLYRSLQAAYALHIIAGDANARAFSASSHRLKGSYSTDNASLSCHSSHSDSVKGLWFGAGAINDDLSFAKSVHTAWMNQFGDPAAAVAALESVLESFRSQGFAATTPGAAAAANTSIEMMAETETEVPTDGFCAAATADRSPSTYSKLVERIARYNSSTLLRLLEQRAGVATKAGRAEASSYLQILRRHGLADVYHYTIVLHSCCEYPLLLSVFAPE